MNGNPCNYHPGQEIEYYYIPQTSFMLLVSPRAINYSDFYFYVAFKKKLFLLFTSCLVFSALKLYINGIILYDFFCNLLFPFDVMFLTFSLTNV